MATRYPEQINELLSDDYIHRHLFGDPRYQSEKRLNRFEHKIYSQHGEDGIINEIFRRIGACTKSFVEIGVESGLETNTTALLAQGWTGAWLEASNKFSRKIRKTFGKELSSGQLRLVTALVTPSNINDLLAGSEADLISIDIDSDDFWVWQAIQARPRVLVIEYNGAFRSSAVWIREKNSSAGWNGTNYYGASLKAMELLGKSKGYVLVGCDFSGNNSFFVREDLAADRFCAPFTSENHFEPPRYFLLWRSGHPRDWGGFQTNFDAGPAVSERHGTGMLISTVK